MINSILRHFEIVTYKDKSGSDNAQVPTAATVDVYKQGSTYRGSTITISVSDPDPTQITVDAVGDYKVNDKFGKNNATAIFIVNAIVDRTTIQISCLSGSKTLSDGDRLVVTTDRPTLYSDSAGSTTTSNPQTADSTTGRVSCYVRQKRFDYTVSGTVSPTRYFYNAEGGSVPESPHYNARDFSTLQAAVDAMSGQGGTLYIPAGVYNATSIPAYTPPLTLPDSTVPIHILGDGVNLTILQANASSSDMLLVQSDEAHIAGLTLDGSAQTGSGRGMVVGPGSARVMFGTTISDCDITNTASWGLYAVGGDPTNGPFSVWSEFIRVRVRGPRSSGAIYVGQGNTTQYFTNCAAVGFFGYGADLFGMGGASLVRCTFEDSRNPGGDIPYVRVRKTFNVTIDQCWFEHHEDIEFNTYFVELGDDTIGHPNFCGGIIIDQCNCIQRTSRNANIIKIYDRCREVHVRNPQIGLPDSPTSSLSDINIGQDCRVTVIGGQIGTPYAYFEPSLSEGADSETFLLFRSRLRVPRRNAPVGSGLTEVGDGDTVFNVDSSRPEVFAGANWGGIATYQSDDRLGQSGSILETTLVAAPVINAVYRITLAVAPTTLSTTGHVTVSLNWRNDYGANSTPLLSVDLDHEEVSTLSLLIWATHASPSTGISYVATKSGTGGAYNLYIRAERL